MMKVPKGDLYLLVVTDTLGKVLRKFLTRGKNCGEALENFHKVEREEFMAGEPLIPSKIFNVHAVPVEFEREIYDL